MGSGESRTGRLSVLLCACAVTCCLSGCASGIKNVCENIRESTDKRFNTKDLHYFCGDSPVQVDYEGADWYAMYLFLCRTLPNDMKLRIAENGIDENAAWITAESLPLEPAIRLEQAINPTTQSLTYAVDIYPVHYLDGFSGVGVEARAKLETRGPLGSSPEPEIKEVPADCRVMAQQFFFAGLVKQLEPQRIRYLIHGRKVASKVFKHDESRKPEQLARSFGAIYKFPQPASGEALLEMVHPGDKMVILDTTPGGWKEVRSQSGVKGYAQETLWLASVNHEETPVTPNHDQQHHQHKQHEQMPTSWRLTVTVPDTAITDTINGKILISIKEGGHVTWSGVNSCPHLWVRYRSISGWIDSNNVSAEDLDEPPCPP